MLFEHSFEHAEKGRYELENFRVVFPRLCESDPVLQLKKSLAERTTREPIRGIVPTGTIARICCVLSSLVF